jgi:hypothetical protein
MNAPLGAELGDTVNMTLPSISLPVQTPTHWYDAGAARWKYTSPDDSSAFRAKVRFPSVVGMIKVTKLALCSRRVIAATAVVNRPIRRIDAVNNCVFKDIESRVQMFGDDKQRCLHGISAITATNSLLYTCSITAPPTTPRFDHSEEVRSKIRFGWTRLPTSALIGLRHGICTTL